MRRGGLLLSALILLIPSAARSQALPDDQIGAIRWTTTPATICNQAFPHDVKRDCFKYSGKFTILNKTKFDPVIYTYEIKTSDGRTGHLESLLRTIPDAEHSKQIAAKVDCDRRGGVRIGMSRDQIYASCWGKPSRNNKTTNTSGVHEQLVYGKRGYLYLDNGILNSIQTSE
jgi:hypothetical protein